MALPSTLSVSAANPTTSFGRAGPEADRVARMSGFSTRVSVGGPSLPFFNFRPNTWSTRQSATAATQTAASAGRAALDASSISTAVSTHTRLTPAGAERAVGPETRVTSAPSSARAPAMA